MKSSLELVIPFRGLNEGVHELNFLIGKQFVDKFCIEDVDDAQVNIAVEMIKREHLLELKISASGNVNVPCDRCLERFPLEISFENSLLVKTDAAENSIIDDELMHLSANEENLDLSQYLYESIVLSLPIQKIHPNDENGKETCNNEMLKYIKGGKPKSKISDPRWDALKNLKL